MEHKAFVFDYANFKAGLAPLIENALSLDDTSNLLKFIDTNFVSLYDPYEGERLNNNWRNSLVSEDVHEIGEVALTLYHKPSADIGLGYSWEEAHDLLQAWFPADDPILLGTPLRTGDTYFDPGRLGSYFQSADEVARNISRVQQIIQQQPAHHALLSPALKMLTTAQEVSQGLYVTF